MKVITAATLFIIVVITSCRKKEPVIDGELSGTFKGQFSSYTTNPQLNAAALTGNVSVVLTGSVYHSTGNDNNIPAGGDGTFAIQGQQLVFTETNIHPANFDWNLLLKGSYDYRTAKDTLFMDKVVNMQHYKYVLIKQ